MTQNLSRVSMRSDDPGEHRAWSTRFRTIWPRRLGAGCARAQNAGEPGVVPTGAVVADSGGDLEALAGEVASSDRTMREIIAIVTDWCRQFTDSKKCSTYLHVVRRTEDAMPTASAPCPRTATNSSIQRLRKNVRPWPGIARALNFFGGEKRRALAQAVRASCSG